MFAEIALYTIFTMAFTQGIFLILGVPTIVTRSIMEILMISLFCQAILKKITHRENFYLFSLWPMVCFFVITCLSSLINKDGWLTFVLFCHLIFPCYFFFLALTNLKFTEEAIHRINYYLCFLFLIQVPASFVKCLIFGISERGPIGTMSMSAGTLSAVFPLFAIAVCFSYFLFRNKIKFIILIFAFFLVGIIGDKRSLSFYLPLVYFVCGYYHIKNIKGKFICFDKFTLKTLSIILFLSFLHLYFASKVLTSLNPEQRRGGSFDIQYMHRVVKDTVAWKAEGLKPGEIFAPGSGHKLEGEYTLGRLVTTERVINILYDNGLKAILLGLGTDNLAESSLVPIKSSEKLLKKFKIAYGITGFTWTVLQVGFLGLFCLVIFHLKIFLKTLHLYQSNHNKNFKPFILSFIAINFVFFIDFFTYSTAFLTLGTLMPVYFYLAFLVFKKGAFENAPQTCQPINEESVICT